MKKKIVRSKPFVETRQHHLKEAAEDYTELIADLIESDGEARTCEVARQLGVSHVTAIRTMKRLQKEGFVETANQKPITLTSKGKRLASYSKRRHSLLLEFLLSLGVSEETATVDVEGMEHHVSPETLEAIQRHLQQF